MLVSDLPIKAVLPQLLEVLREQPNAVLVAPPGAGKTTAVAPALLDQPWCTGEILLLSPRRLAARAAAERMAERAGEKVGETIGYATRLDSRRSASTRILVLTEGIFRNRIQADPELAGVSAVLFDEVHERSLDSDFGLALALDAQAALRPDLRLLAMSATLDGERFAALMGDAPVIESEGRSFPIDLRYLGRAAEKRIEDEMAPAIRRALAEAEGSLLAFLPEPVIVNLFRRITEHFRSGEFAFNDYGRMGRLTRTAMKLNPRKATNMVGRQWGYPGFKDAHHPETWSPRLTLVEEASLAHEPEVDLFTGWARASTRLAGRFKATARKARILRYRF